MSKSHDDISSSSTQSSSNDHQQSRCSFTSMSMESGASPSASNLDRYKRIREEKSSLELKDDVDRYLSDDCVELNDKFDVLAWWKLNESKYQVLSKIARDVLTVPVSIVAIVASESTFNTGGRILDSFRSSLTPTIVEALICTRNWIRGQSILLDLPPQLEELETCAKIEKGVVGSSTIVHT